jgi:polyisoprenoid-binding protein YceI
VGFSIDQFNLVSNPFRSVTGKFQVYTGAIEAVSEDFNDAKIDFSVITGSINTGNYKRDRHLRSSSFFDVQNFPVMKFRSVAFIKVSDEYYVLEGDLSIRGVSRRIVFDVNYEALGHHDPNGQAAQFTITGKINRLDFGIKGTALSEIFIGKEVTISLQLEFLKQQL